MRRASIGSYIRALRLQKGMTQNELAGQLHVTDKAVSKWERALSFPDISLLPKLAEVFGVTVGDLLREYDDDSPPSQLVQKYQMTSDIRAPLHIILGCVDLADSFHEDPEKYRRYLEAIRISGEYLLSVLDNQNEVSLEERLLMQGEERKKTGTQYRFTGSRILIVDDIAVNREIAGQILKYTGTEVEFAEDGRICVEMVAENPPGYYDLILMDLAMPNMDGIEAAKRIRAMEDPEKSAIPIIAMTANAEEKDRKAAFDAGMNCFEEKPISTERLLKAIHLFL